MDNLDEINRPTIEDFKGHATLEDGETIICDLQPKELEDVLTLWGLCEEVGQLKQKTQRLKKKADALQILLWENARDNHAIIDRQKTENKVFGHTVRVVEGRAVFVATCKSDDDYPEHMPEFLKDLLRQLRNQ